MTKEYEASVCEMW